MYFVCVEVHQRINHVAVQLLFNSFDNVFAKVTHVEYCSTRYEVHVLIAIGVYISVTPTSSNYEWIVLKESTSGKQLVH